MPLFEGTPSNLVFSKFMFLKSFSHSPDRGRSKKNFLVKRGIKELCLGSDYIVTNRINLPIPKERRSVPDRGWSKEKMFGLKRAVFG